jgi:predicted transcriptional regulator
MAMTGRKRKGILAERGVTVRQIAISLGVTGPHVSMVLHGRRRSVRVEQAIAKAAKCNALEMFGPPETVKRQSVA